MASCLKAFCPNVPITFFSLNLPRVITALNNCSSSVANAGWLLQSVLSNWHSNKRLLLNVKWDFWRGEKKRFFSSYTSHVHVDQKDTAWVPVVSAVQTSAVIHQESFISQVSMLNTGENSLWMWNRHRGPSGKPVTCSEAVLPRCWFSRGQFQGVREAAWDQCRAHSAKHSYPSLFQ